MEFGFYTALHLAVNNDRFDTVRLLLRHGFDTSLRSCDGLDAVQHAAVSGRARALEFLLEELKLAAGRRGPTGTRCSDRASSSIGPVSK